MPTYKVHRSELNERRHRRRYRRFRAVALLTSGMLLLGTAALLIGHVLHLPT